jgi:hypothetical protein
MVIHSLFHRMCSAVDGQGLVVTGHSVAMLIYMLSHMYRTMQLVQVISTLNSLRW